MLSELRITDLGVIESASLLLGPGMTVLTGETGAGKTMLVEAIDLLVGGRADAGIVRPGAAEAVVEGRFLVDDDREVVLCRVVPAVGRSRAYVDGRLAPAGVLAEVAAGLVDLHGQHAHQSLLATRAQRAALDQHAGVDLAPLRVARAELARLDRALAETGGDERARAREIDLLRYQGAELDGAGLVDGGEDDGLRQEEDRLGDAVAHRDAAAAAHASLRDDGGALDAVGVALAAVAGRAPFGELEPRLRALEAELADVADELRATGEGIEDDPERLSRIRERRHLLHELRRKYGETLDDVIAYRDEVVARLADLEAHDARAAVLDAERALAATAERRAAAVVADARRAAAPAFGAAVQAHLADLAMARARLEVEVGGDDPGDDVTFLLAANPGGPLAPLAKVASGGELARAMLAVRLVLTGIAPGPADEERDRPPATLVFDEVDAGIGGAAAVAVGRALAALAPAEGGGAARQVLVVTHLAQVAAAADHHVVVRKEVLGLGTDARTRSSADEVRGEERVVELSRMLAGDAGSASARELAEDLLRPVMGRGGGPGGSS